ncbi:MAG: hypothetical protein WHS38_04065 [Thermodesulforhabdaceae bacterium]
MCTHQKIMCQCGLGVAYLFYRDDILPEETVVSIYCPACSHMTEWDPSSMIRDVGWIIQYDMDVARFYLKKKGIVYRDDQVSPEFVFFEDYCSWYGLTPTDIEENAHLAKELEDLKRQDLRLYFETFKKRRINRVNELKAQGYLKALRA